ncbi:16384_t:CDS:1, partial [Funneliformis caledonium]
ISETSEKEDDDSEMADNITISGGEESFTQFHEPNFKCNNNDTIDLTEQWVRVIQNWMGMIGKENFSDSDEANLLAFIAVDRTIHLADDLLAKWHLSSIFNNRFKSSEFVNILINL